MSGGVDSSVAAAMLMGEGAEVIGVTLKFFDCDKVSEKKKSCCGTEDRRQVLNVCEHLGIRHYFLDMKDVFSEKVLKKCWEEYASGRTPNPCVLCNRYLKFGSLIEYAKSLGADGIITGHYAKIARNCDGRPTLSRGDDKNKDQSYFLSLVKSDDLEMTFTPLGSMNKKQVRKMASELALPNSEKKESQDACVGLIGENFSETLRRIFGAEAKSGKFLDMEGREIGEHNGIHNFTVGQRRGFGKGFGKPVFVKSINPAGDVTLTENERDLFSKELVVRGVNWLMPEFSRKKSFIAKTQIRYRHDAAESEVTVLNNESVKVVFLEAQRAVSPGQAAVFYADDTVIGGGIID